MEQSVQTRRIDGKQLAADLRERLRQRVAEAQLSPTLATILVGDDPASAVYVRSKTRAARQIGIDVRDHHLPATTSQDELHALLTRLNEDPEINGILLQLPLPAGLDEEALLDTIAPEKDVDGFHPVNLGLLLRGRPGLRPCTPAGCMDLIHHTGTSVSGKHAVVVGRSNIVGKPVALMLLAEHATVTICHSRTPDLPDQVRAADIVVAAAGRPNMIQGDWIKPGAIVIDVGINRLDDGSLVGDVDFDAAQGRAAWITPVPGGVGPMTIAHLMQNTVEAFCRQTSSG
ncbi:MAG: bifunctional methylenetetrahydrofolate dehydrogenase/methenyltetrahydrofolate cyclohydrolase FolD [Candidatus Dadabacteria bacterium]|nr:MAG: bifunctional methylenetetrahydrofolate dehydrogenase/methenyltetrahydrofolate cyclohydrolase FolD [Candidatus Dadabacteria bacterium]